MNHPLKLVFDLESNFYRSGRFWEVYGGEGVEKCDFIKKRNIKLDIQETMKRNQVSKEQMNTILPSRSD